MAPLSGMCLIVSPEPRTNKKTIKMRNRIITLMMLLMAGTTAAYAHDFSQVCSTGQTLYYSFGSGGVEVVAPDSGWNSSSSFTKPTGNMTIPATVSYMGGTYNVKTIASGAFSGCSGLHSVYIPNTVTEIGEGTFSNCSFLRSVHLSENLLTIRSMAFSYCTHLTSIFIPSTVEFIGTNNYDYSHVRGNPDPLHVGAGNPFMGCVNLDTIQVASGNTVYDSRGGCNAIIKTATNSLLSGCSTTIIPNSVITICAEAFCGQTRMSAISIPGAVREILGSAFKRCSGLTHIYWGDSIEYIGGEAFRYCAGIDTLVIPRSVTNMDVPFGDCGLKYVIYSADSCSSGSICHAINDTTSCTMVITENVRWLPAGRFTLPGLKTVYYNAIDARRPRLYREGLFVSGTQRIPGGVGYRIPSA